MSELSDVVKYKIAKTCLRRVYDHVVTRRRDNDWGTTGRSGHIQEQFG
jgi:hypothetical protein